MGNGNYAESRKSLKDRLQAARARTDGIFGIVHSDCLFERPIVERHRIIFYIGHLEAFDWNLLCRDALGFSSFNAEFDKLFAFGIDPVDGGLPKDQPSDWPALARVVEYNGRARQQVDACVERVSFDDPAIPYLRSGWGLKIAIEHRLMHAETFGYMLQWLPYEKKIAQPHNHELAGPAVRRRMIEIPAGRVTMGLDRGASPYEGWDNEYEQHLTEVPAFAIDSHNVTNRDYFAFVRAGGYREAHLWRTDDWEWIRRNGIENPRFWVRRNDQWFWRGMFAEVPLPLDWPVYVSQAEASAYARWAGKSLPTEAQFERAAFGAPEGSERCYPWGDAPPASKHGNFDFRSWDPVPVGARPEGASAFGVADLVGNGWEWTCSPFAPFPGFQPLPFYRTYSANFFDGKHFVIRGGSALTEASLLRRTFRNWFQPRYPNIYAAFRCVEN